MTEVRFIDVGDIHLSSTNQVTIDKLTKVINIANQSNVNFVSFLGDFVDASLSAPSWQIVRSKLNQLIKPYYAVSGNHDVGSSNCISPCPPIPTGSNIECSFHTYLGIWPDQVHVFNKSNKIFNIIIPATCGISTDPKWYLNFNRVIDKTLPTLVLSHGPISSPPVTPGTYNGYMLSNPSDIRIQLNKSNFPNLLACYAGHIHYSSYNVINGVTYVTEDNLSGTGPSTNYVGYTRIRDNYIVDYAQIRYQNDDGTQAQFIDPFPNIGCPEPSANIRLI